MATSSNLSSIIRYYSEKANSPFIDFREFCVYIKKYAEHHLEEQAELVKYLDSPGATVSAELQGLSEKHLVSVISVNGKKIIVYIAFFANKYAERYKEIHKNNSIPYPIISDLPEKFPIQALERKNANHYISSIIDREPEKVPVLYVLEFAKDITPMLLPATVSIKLLLETAQQKVKKVLKKEEYHDYFLKKLRNTNPTKEISIRNFFSHFVDDEIFRYTEFNDGDDYYIWNQTLYYISQDFGKVQDKTVEDVTVLQACQILEIYSSYQKEKFQREKERKEALKNLEESLKTTPFFFSMDQLLKFQDKNGRLLYGRYTEDDLKEFLQNQTTEGSSNELPPLLIFKAASDTRYYIYKQYVTQVVTRLSNEAHISIEKEIEDGWYASLLDFNRLPAMNNLDEFELLLRRLVEKKSPILHALLTANFMKTLAYDNSKNPEAGYSIFANGHLLQYRDLLELDQSKILSNARLRLPFYYTIPVLSWIIGFFHNLKKRSPKEKINKEQKTKIDNEEELDLNKPSRQDIFATKAEEIAKELIPEGSTIDRELDYLVGQWNRMLSKEAYNNLTEDVNSLIRDYTRRVLHSLSTASFTRERIEALAQTLVSTPNMKRIPDEKPLTEYVTLYILRLISNL